VPVGPDGVFNLAAPPWWMLWRTVPSHRFEAGSKAEAAAIARWRNLGGDIEWQLQGRPFSRSQWERRDRSAWHEALAELRADDSR
jgi:hypothetical protein